MFNKFFLNVNNFINLLKLSINSKNYKYNKEKLIEYKKGETFSNHLALLINKFLEKNQKIMDDLFYNELIKCFIKTEISYSQYSKLIAYKVSKTFVEKNNIDKSKVYFTNFYPIIHLKNDKIEEGNYHIDQDGNSTIYTLWTPITDYNYNALSYFKFGYLIHKLLIKLMGNKIYKFYKNIKVQKYLTIIWSGLFIHKGNLNTSNDYSSAIVLWLSIGNKKKSNISENIYEFEKKNKNEYNSADINLDFEFKNSLENYTLFEKIINDIKNFNKKNILNIENFYLNFVLKNEFLKNNINNIKFSFFLSLLAQRLKTILDRNISININNLSHLIIYIDFLSCLCGMQSYSSFLRLQNSILLSEKDHIRIKNCLIENKLFKNLNQINNFVNQGYQ